MILYLDTSSMVKLYMEEDGSHEVVGLVNASELVATSLVAYAEARAAFARRFREKAFLPDEFLLIKKYFEADWNDFFVLKPTWKMCRHAGELAEKHELRGFDSIHLASGMMLREETGLPVVFSCFDQKLKKASIKEEFLVNA